MPTKNLIPAPDDANAFQRARAPGMTTWGLFDVLRNVTYRSCNNPPHRSMLKAPKGFPCSVGGDELIRLAVSRGDRPEWRRFPFLPSGKTVPRRLVSARAFRESRSS
jgi:hypothetical protein